MSTNRGSYPHAGTAYPHSLGPETGRKPPQGPRSIGVQQLAKRPHVASEVVVFGHLAFDLLAAVQDGGVVSSAERFADPHEWGLGLLAHEVHGDLAREDDLPIARLPLDLVE